MGRRVSDADGFAAAAAVVDDGGGGGGGCDGDYCYDGIGLGFRSRPGSVDGLSTSVDGRLRRAEVGCSIRRFWLSRACLSSVLREL